MIIICENRSAVYRIDMFYVHIRMRQDLVTIICNATAYHEAHHSDDAFGLVVNPDTIHEEMTTNFHIHLRIPSVINHKTLWMFWEV